jgi:hypothetical protein
VLLHHSSFSALPPNKSLLPASPLSLFAVILLSASSCPRGAVLCASPHSFGARPRPTFPPLNLHRARVSRNRGRLPSSRCIETAPEHPAFILILLLMRASDTSLGLLDRNGFRVACWALTLVSSFSVRAQSNKRRCTLLPDRGVHCAHFLRNVLCTKCARIDHFQSVGLSFEREAGSPICCKR